MLIAADGWINSLIIEQRRGKIHSKNSNPIKFQSIMPKKVTARKIQLKGLKCEFEVCKKKTTQM